MKHLCWMMALFLAALCGFVFGKDCAAGLSARTVGLALAWTNMIDSADAVNVTEHNAETDGEKLSLQNSAPPVDTEASRRAIEELKKYLQLPPGDRPWLGEQEFAAAGLTRQHADEAERLLWEDHIRCIRQTRAEEMAARRLVRGDLEMRFHYTVSGDKPEKGRSLYISLHGGGGAPRQVNDRQWENQKRLYQVKEGVYLAPRAPTDTWNMWHQGHMDGFLDRLIENLIVLEDVDANRVYLLGYSAGGDGVYQLAPRMADRFAAAAMMAGHPNDASPLGLRNIAFTIHVGGRDSAYNRNEVARQWGQKLEALQKNDPGGYVNWTCIYESKGHWLDGEDAAALPWMAEHTRNPLPNRVVWRQDDVTGSRFYWLAAAGGEPSAGDLVIASLEGQQFDLQADGTGQVVIRVNDRMLDMDEDVTVICGGKELYRGRVKRSIRILGKTLAERGDPASVFSGEIAVSPAEAAPTAK